MTLCCGLVGPGRRRNGLGPFLARWLEAAGIQVKAAAGRSLERSLVDCDRLAGELGHGVAAYGSLAKMLAAEEFDALVIASPQESHLEGIEAALAAGLHLLCEKPLVTEAEIGRVASLVEGFVERGLVLWENCSWPETLPAMLELYPQRGSGLPRRVAMGLSPSGRGRSMVEDSLSHFLSILQALLPVNQESRVTGLEWSCRDREAEAVDLCFSLAGDFPGVLARFELRHCQNQPRPAWISIDGDRMDRHIRLADYQISFRGGGRETKVDDPLARLVYGFANQVRNPDLERIRSEAGRIRDRARLYQQILADW